MKRVNRFSVFVSIIVLSMLILACGSESNSAVPAQPLPGVEIPVVTVTSQSQELVPASVPAIPETRRLTLEYPPKMRAGVESNIVRLTLEVDDLGNITPTAQFEGNVVNAETIEIPDLYETHKVIVEARLDLAGMEVSPPGSTFESLQPGQSATFYWSILPQDTGTYRGTVWLHLNFSNKLSGEENRIAVSAQVIEIEAVDFFGLSVNVARTSGLLGSIIGGVVGFPFLGDLVRFILKKRKTS